VQTLAITGMDADSVIQVRAALCTESRILSSMSSPGAIHLLCLRIRCWQYTCFLKTLPAVQLIATMEKRQRAYSVELHNTYFPAETFIKLVLALLRSKSCQSINLRRCGSDVSPWERQQAYGLLSQHLHCGQAHHMYQDDGAPFGMEGSASLLQGGQLRERENFWRDLLKRWVAGKVCTAIRVLLHKLIEAATSRHSRAQSAGCRFAYRQVQRAQISILTL
jgi:hypothetical protein